MAKVRSPSYPAISLKEAIEYVTAVWQKDFQNPISRAVAAEHMGYKSLNGKSLGVLAALIKYGLLEGRGDNTRVSDLAVHIIAHPPSSPERVEALKTAAGSPDLFIELNSRFQGGKVSDQAIKSYLITQKFIPAAADAAIRSYRETLQFVESEAGGYSAPVVEQSTVQQVQPTSIQPHTFISHASGMRVSLVDDRLEVSASLTDVAAVEKLIRWLSANKDMLPNKKGETSEQ